MPTGDGEEPGESSFPPGNTLNRKELQKQLKSWGVRATGSTAVLLERYDAERIQRSKSSDDSPVEVVTTAATAAAAALPVSTSPAAAAAAASSVSASPAAASSVSASPAAAAAASSVSPSPAARAAAVSKEKRRKHFRKSCPFPIRQRIERAKTQRMYLIHRGDIVEDMSKCEFAVLGSTGNIYTVTISHLPRCTCPDHVRGNSLCKHVLFVLLKVMAIDEDSPHLYQAAWLTSELQEMFANFAARRGLNNNNNAVLANDKVRQAYAKLQSGKSFEGDDEDEKKPEGGVARKSLDDDADCPICFDSMQDDAPDKLTYCRVACGTNFHVDCIRRWCQQSANPTCPNCRQPWEEAGGNKKKTGKNDGGREGYTNLGQLQGQSPARDTSTYYNRKRRRYDY